MRKFIFILLISAPLFAQKFELPTSNSKKTYTIENTAYSLGFAENCAIPVWESHSLNPAMLSGTASASEEWQIDNRVKGYKVTAKDISTINLEAVQLFPKAHAANNVQAFESSFLTSNVVFMNKQLKDSIWTRITSLAEEISKTNGSVYIISGPIFDKDPLKIKYTTNRNIPIPTHFYRIFLYLEDGNYTYKAFKFANRIPTDYERKCPLDEFLCNLYQIEADTALDFFDREIDLNFRHEKMKFLEKQVVQ